MSQSLLRSACVVLFVGVLAVPSAPAKISRENPYRTFNISGQNYGAQRWEKQNKSSATKVTKSKRSRTRFRLFFGR